MTVAEAFLDTPAEAHNGVVTAAETARCGRSRDNQPASLGGSAVFRANELIDSGNELEPRIEVAELATCTGCGEEFDHQLHEQCPHCFTSDGLRIEPSRYEMTADGPRAVGGLSPTELRRRVLAKCHETKPGVAEQIPAAMRAIEQTLAEVFGHAPEHVTLSLVFGRYRVGDPYVSSYLNLMVSEKTGDSVVSVRARSLDQFTEAIRAKFRPTAGFDPLVLGM